MTAWAAPRYKEFVRVTFPEHRGDASATYDDDGDEYPRTQSSFLPPNHVLTAADQIK